MSRRVLIALAAVLLGLSTARVASAQESVPSERYRLDLSTAVAPSAMMPVEQGPNLLSPAYRKPSGPSTVMTSLYAATAAMQALDVHSTLMAIDRGAVEGNPVMGNLTGNKAAFMALKAGVAFSTVMAARNMSKRNKVAAIATLVAINSAYAMVVTHNYRVAQKLR